MVIVVGRTGNEPEVLALTIAEIPDFRPVILCALCHPAFDRDGSRISEDSGGQSHISGITGTTAAIQGQAVINGHSRATTRRHNCAVGVAYRVRSIADKTITVQ